MTTRSRKSNISSPRRKCDYIYLLLSLVPIGYTITYKLLAELVSTSPRAVGVCMKYNTNLIVVPCHRVVSTRGIGGFSLGVDFKKKLLELEEYTPNKKLNTIEEFWDIVDSEGVVVDINNLEQNS